MNYKTLTVNGISYKQIKRNTLATDACYSCIARQNDKLCEELTPICHINFIIKRKRCLSEYKECSY